MSLSGDNDQLKMRQYQNRLTGPDRTDGTVLFRGHCAMQIEFVLC